MNIKSIMLCAAASVSAVLMAGDTPEVSNVKMEQATLGRKVTITYELGNIPNGAVVTLDVETNAPGNVWASIGGAAVCNAQGAVWRKVTSADADANGKYTITWRPDLSWEGHNIADGGARAVVTAWALDNTPDYMVVDISASAKANTQCYYPGSDFVPGGVSNSLYKTSTLLLRKIMAKDVKWTMGSVNESGRNDNEATHQVSLGNNYYIGVYEVTYTQWRLITGYSITSSFIVDNAMRPVTWVAYSDIRTGEGTQHNAAAGSEAYLQTPYDKSFMGLLRTKTGIDFDLPSEAQWEFAARAGNGEGYWGDGSAIGISNNKDVNLSRLGRYLNNPDTNSSDERDIDPSLGGTAIVGSYCANDWGLYDMHGNASEWCLDGYSANISSYNGSINTKKTTLRVLRGGGWKSEAGNCRPAYRSSLNGATRSSSHAIGFRAACTAGLQ